VIQISSHDLHEGWRQRLSEKGGDVGESAGPPTSQMILCWNHRLLLKIWRSLPAFASLSDGKSGHSSASPAADEESHNDNEVTRVGLANINLTFQKIRSRIPLKDLTILWKDRLTRCFSCRNIEL
jgi:hypothetical protein